MSITGNKSLYSRKDILARVKDMGYQVTPHDLHWAVKNNLIQPVVLNSTMFLYDATALQALELIGELKARGFDKSLITKIVETDSLELIKELVMWSVVNDGVR